jgi:hypothetical protein
MVYYFKCDGQYVHFLSAPPERKWTESPVVRDPAFRILKAGKEEAEIVTRSSICPLAEIPVRRVSNNFQRLRNCTGIKPTKRCSNRTPPTISEALVYEITLHNQSPQARKSMAERGDGLVGAFRFRPTDPFVSIARDFPAEIFGMCGGRCPCAFRFPRPFFGYSLWTSKESNEKLRACVQHMPTGFSWFRRGFKVGNTLSSPTIEFSNIGCESVMITMT